MLPLYLFVITIISIIIIFFFFFYKNEWTVIYGMRYEMEKESW